MMSLCTHSSAGCKFLPSIQISIEVQCHSDKREPIPSSTLHIVGGSDVKLPQPFHQTWRQQEKIEAATWSCYPCWRPETGATCLQETRSPDSFTKSTPSLQAGKALHSAEAPYQWVLSTIKDQPWVWRPKLIQYDLTLSETEEYGSYHDGKEYKTIHYRSLQKYLKELICRGFLKKYIPTPEIDAGFGQTLIPPPTQSQHTISQYKSIEWSNLTTINMAVPPFLTHPVSQFHVFHFSIE